MNLQSLVTLGALPLVLAALTLQPVAAAPAAPITMRATMHGSELNLRGSNFVPGSMVRVAVVDFHSWRAIASARMQTEPATYTCPIGASVFCGQRNPAAGQFEGRLTLHAPLHALLRVLYRSGRTVGLIKVDRS
jgi:hypothetical protein